MTTLLFIGSVLNALLGIIIFAGAKGSIHEATAVLFFVTAAILFSGGAIVAAINRATESIHGLHTVMDMIRKHYPTTEEPTALATPPVIPVPAFIPEPPPKPANWVEAARAEIKQEQAR